MRATPNHLIAGIMLGAVCACASFPIGHQAHAQRILILPAVVLLLGGFAAMLLLGSRLQSGVEGERWPEAQLSPLRLIAGSRFWKLVLFALLALMLASLIWKGISPLFWIAFILMQAWNSLTRAFRRSPPLWVADTALDLTASASIHSSSWGSPAPPSR